MDKPSFSPYFWNNLAVNNPLGRRDITEQDARDWFDLIWPIYEQTRTRIQNPRHKLRVAQFWVRVSAVEIERARALGAERRRSVKAERLADVASKAFPTQHAPPRTDLPPLKRGRGVRRG